MSENEETNLEENVQEVNGIKISEEVVATIAGMAVSEVKGVASTNSGIISEVFGKKSFSKGIKVQINEKAVTIDVFIVVEYGSRIPDIAWEVQNRVKSAVEDMTGLKVLEVNIQVQGVNLPKAEKGKVNETETTEEENNTEE